MRLTGCTIVTAVLTVVGVTGASEVAGRAQTELAYFNVSGGGTGRGRSPTTVALRPPDGVQTVRGGEGTTNTGFESHIGLETPLALSAISAHYTSRVESGRWRVVGRLSDGNDLAVTRFSAPTGAADAATALLIVTRLAATRVDIALRFIQIRPATTASSSPSVNVGRAQSQSARIGSPQRSAQASEALTGEERLLREILLFDPVTTEPGQPYEIQRSVPPGFPRELLPPGAATGVVAAAVARDQTTVVGIASTLPLASASKFVRGLAAAGWPAGSPLGGFFRPSSLYGLACRALQAAQMRFVPRSAGGTYVRVSVSIGQCGRPAGSPFLDVAMPMLPHPPGASITAGGGGGGGLDSHHWGVRVTSGLAWPEVVTYYASQMSASEWPAGGRVADSELVVTRHRSTTTAGEPVHAILTLFKVPGGPTVDAWLRVVRLTPR
jgi:hypothetical protein